MREPELQPNSDQPGRCPSIDPYNTLQCGRSIHDDDHCRLGGISWIKGTPRYLSETDKAVEKAVKKARREALAPIQELMRSTPFNEIPRHDLQAVIDNVISGRA